MINVDGKLIMVGHRHDFNSHLVGKFDTRIFFYKVKRNSKPSYIMHINYLK